MKTMEQTIQIADMVYHKTFDVVGKVIGMYLSKEDPTKILLVVDVDGVIYNESYIVNWEVVDGDNA